MSENMIEILGIEHCYCCYCLCWCARQLVLANYIESREYMGKATEDRWNECMNEGRRLGGTLPLVLSYSRGD